MSERYCQRPGCGRPIPSLKRRDARWCSRSCEGKARRAARRKADFEAAHGVVAELLPVEDRSLAELHQNATPPQHRADIEAGHADDDLAEFSDEYDEDQDDDEVPEWSGLDSVHYAPRDTWRRWRTFAKRHNSEHPAQTADRIARRKAAEAASAARRDAATAGRVQDRWDSRTAGNVAENGAQSRRLNVRHTEQPPVPAQAFDFTNESVSGGPYRSGRAAGHWGRYGGSAWVMQDGW